MKTLNIPDEYIDTVLAALILRKFTVQDQLFKLEAATRIKHLLQKGIDTAKAEIEWINNAMKEIQ